MAKYLATPIPVLTKAVVSEEVPASERRDTCRTTTRRRAKPRKASRHEHPLALQVRPHDRAQARLRAAALDALAGSLE